MENVSIAWIGTEGRFSRKLEKGLIDHYDQSQVSFRVLNLESNNLHLIFSKYPESNFQILFVDFTENREYKIELCKIIQKYQFHNSVVIVGIVNEQDQHIKHTYFLTLPIKIFAVKKIDIEEIIEDIEIISNNFIVSNTYFTTPGYQDIMWVQIPCKANYKVNKFKIYSPIENHSFKKSFKDTLISYQNQLGLNYGEKLNKWLLQSNDIVNFSIKEASRDDIELQGKNFCKEEKYFKADLDKRSLKKLGGKIDSYRVCNDSRRRIVVFDSNLDFFTCCWKKSGLDKKINMFNFPFINENFSFIDALAPELIIVRNHPGLNEEQKELHVELKNELIKKLKNQEDQPTIIVFNSQDDPLENEYPKLLKIPFDISKEYLTKICHLLTKGSEFSFNSVKVHLDEEIHYWKNSRLKNAIYYNTPIMIREISEKIIKFTGPFQLDRETLVYEKDLFGVIILLFKDDSSPNPNDFCGLFLCENEMQKMEIRKYINQLNFTPKTIEQLKEQEESMRVREEYLEAIEERRQSELDALKEDEVREEIDDNKDFSTMEDQKQREETDGPANLS